MNKYTKIVAIFCVSLLNLGIVQAQTNSKGKFLDTLRAGIRYQVQEFHTLNQKLLENCNCDESLRLKERSLQGISATFYEPLTKNLSLGADLGGSFGTVMDDNRNYKKYTFAQMRVESYYHLLGPKMKLRPYLTGSAQLVTNLSRSFFSLPVGAGLRYQLMRGGSLHIQTAYDRGFSPKLAKNMITNVGFHVPLYKPKEYKAEPSNALYLSNQTVSKPAVASPVATPVATPVAAPVATPVVTPVVTPVEPLVTQITKPELLRVVFFDTDKYSLNKVETAKVLAEVNAFAKQYPDAKIYLTGHTDSVLDEAYNLALSKKRVQAVFDWLKNQGIAADRISSSFKGKAAPVSNNDSVIGRAGNRRVEILVK